jgi:hypothetical protein
VLPCEELQALRLFVADELIEAGATLQALSFRGSGHPSAIGRASKIQKMWSSLNRKEAAP